MWIERIGQPARTPWLLTFDADVLMVLDRTLRAVHPQEGCGLLIGHRHVDGWCLRTVWPCCNVWKAGLDALPESSGPASSGSMELSRCTRFLVDAREQLHAQRWARARGLSVIGSAHSHPAGDAVPSRTDRRWVREPGLMMILGADQSIRAWWLEPEVLPKTSAVQDTG